MMQAVRRRLWQWLGRVPLTPLQPLLPLALSPRHHPTLSLGGALMLARLRLQRHGPRLANYSGSRLSPADLALLAERYQQWLDAPLPGDADAAALRAWRAAAIASVPRYRHYPLDAPLHQLPTLSRADLADIWSLVPERRLNEGGIANCNRRLGRTDGMLLTAGNGQPLGDRWRGVASACDDYRHDEVKRLRIELRCTAREE